MVHITKGAQNDFLEVARLDHQAWMDAPNARNIPDGEHVWRIWTEHALLFVAKEDETVLGAIVAFPCISGEWYVHKLFVRADRRRSGIGRSLFGKLLEKVDELGVVCFLTVAPQNEKLIEFYRSLGFTRARWSKDTIAKTNIVAY